MPLAHGIVYVDQLPEPLQPQVLQGVEYIRVEKDGGTCGEVTEGWKLVYQLSRCP